jgi:hypothetical protein
MHLGSDVYHRYFLTEIHELRVFRYRQIIAAPPLRYSVPSEHMAVIFLITGNYWSQADVV